ncbi:unnamed protein product [Miscanthus lutarioriparius]|uniref:Uncharacterized protein n=1 Tax=Miscanthus lutarioriparius TaxID=422564 RepID=A0A811MQV5_9POAL|nr:unnamed protein product [Miscanthus lutarioriparius]
MAPATISTAANHMPKDWPCIAPVAATTPGTSYDGQTVKAYVRRLGNTASPRRARQPGERAVSAPTAAANMQIPGMVIHGRGKYGSTRRQSTVTPAMATAAAERCGPATPLCLSKLGLVGPGTPPVYKHQKLAKCENECIHVQYIRQESKCKAKATATYIYVRLIDLSAHSRHGLKKARNPFWVQSLRIILSHEKALEFTRIYELAGDKVSRQ